LLEKMKEGKALNLMNKYFLIFTDEAGFDLIEISEWYRDEAPELDIKFRKAIEKCH